MIKFAAARLAVLTLGVFMLLGPAGARAAEPTADEIIQRALDYMRGKASISSVTMTIHSVLDKK